MPSISKSAARRDKVASHTVRMKLGDENFDVFVEYWPNRITPEPYKDEDDDSSRRAKDACTWIKSWDLLGELEDRDGHVVVAEDEPVPVTPEMFVLLPTQVTNEIIEQILRLEFPKQFKSNNGRARS